MKGFEHWSETGSYKILPRLKGESWLEEKRTEMPYFHWVQIRKRFDPRTSTATPKKGYSDFVKTTEREEAPKK